MIPSASSHWDGLPPPGAASSPKPWECDAAASVATLVWPARLMGTRALTPTRPAKKTHRAQKKHPNYPKKHQKTYKTKRPKIPKKNPENFRKTKNLVRNSKFFGACVLGPLPPAVTFKS